MLQIERIRHTSYVVRASGRGIAFDPIIPRINAQSDSAGLPDEVAFLDGVDAVFISHSHADHFDLPALWVMRRDFPIYLPAADCAARWPMAAALRSLGFTNVRRLDDWQSVVVTDLKVTAIPAPRSLEGIPQASYLVEAGGTHFFNAVDALEDDGIFAELGARFDIDVATLPVNCGFMFGDVRNQMSPPMAVNAARMLRAKTFVPTGVSQSPADIGVGGFSPFPYDGDRSLAGSLRRRLPHGCSCLELHEGWTLVADGARPVQLVKRPKTGSGGTVGRAVDHAIASLVLVRSPRDEHYFGLPARLAYVDWVARWRALSALSMAVPARLADVLATLPLEYVGLPVTAVFPRALRRLHGVDAARCLSVLAASVTMSLDLKEREFVAKAVSLFAGTGREIESLAQIEHSIYVQARRYAELPSLPAGLDTAAATRAHERQLARTLAIPDLIYPRLRGSHKPVEVDAELWETFGSPSSLPSGTRVQALALLDRAKGQVVLRLRVLKPAEALWLTAIGECHGQRSVSDLCRTFGWSAEYFGAMCRAFCGWAGGALEFDGLPP